LTNLDLGHRNRLREKYYKNGIDSLHDYEILELLLTYSIPRKNCKPIAKELLKKNKNIKELFDAKEENLLEIDGLGRNTYIFLRLIKDITKICTQISLYEKVYINCTKELVDYLKLNIDNKELEYFKIILLNTNNQLVYDEILFKGTIDRSSIYIRELIKKIFKFDAKSVIFAHNHPSGSLKPSLSDINFTNKCKEILNNLEINLLDHIIVSSEGHYSFLENGIL